MRVLRPILLGLVGFALAGLGLVGFSQTVVARPQHAAPGAKAPTKSIAETIAGSKDHKTLAALVKAAGLFDMLSGTEPYTLFAPTDQAFKKLPPGAVDNLFKPENKAQLQTVLTYHIVPGALTSRELLEKIKEGGGKAQLKTVQLEPLTVEVKGRALEITDAKSDSGIVTGANMMQSNGVVHVVDRVFLP